LLNGERMAEKTMIADIKKTAEQKMGKTVGNAEARSHKIRTGAPTPGCSTTSSRLLRHADADQPVRNVTLADARTITCSRGRRRWCR
jgi:ribosome recycling factor